MSRLDEEGFAGLIRVFPCHISLRKSPSPGGFEWRSNFLLRNTISSTNFTKVSHMRGTGNVVMYSIS